VRKAVCDISRNLSDEDQINIEHSPELIKLVMQSTLLSFVDKCHEDDTIECRKEKGLVIGGHESSAWQADSAGACFADNIKSHFRKTKCCGACRDDATAVHNNKLSHNDMLKWRTQFKNSADRPAGGNCLQLTCIMLPDESRREPLTAQNDPKTSIETGKLFPHLHTKLVRADNGDPHS